MRRADRLRDRLVVLIAGQAVRATRAAEVFLNVCGKTILEATTEKDFAPGHRWLKLLGFQFVEILQNYGADGAGTVTSALPISKRRRKQLAKYLVERAIGRIAS